ncbi:MAG: sensor domain-containing protein [Holophagaceae bacterium]|uniref:Sensor domain-containing protein n=1 Tax=Candidatus Geothrix skivensis TaxID=2954439 RepID=A0A9D7SKG1_9BACT|nr:sensor domain-containing protein [Candidatus Geothrix skivensis]
MSLLAQPHPGFFEVLASRRAYTTLLYLLLSMATGILAFTYAVTGLALSLGLAILIIGLPVALLFLLGARLLSVAEAHLLRILVDEEDGEGPALLPRGEGLVDRLRALLGERRTWTSLLYLLLLMPLGIAYFTTLVSLLAASFGLLAVPVARLLHTTGTFSLDLSYGGWALAHPNSAALLCGLAGLVLLPLTFHLAMLLGRFQIWLAGHLLVKA